MILVVTGLDTTWRAFVPTIGGTLAGIGLDRLFGTSPVLLFVSIAIGTALSIYLVARQLIEVRKQQ